MNNNQYYILKYNLKYALGETSSFSQAEKETIRQAEKVSQSISRGYYIYAITDVIWSARNYKKYYGGNIHTYKKMM